MRLADDSDFQRLNDLADERKRQRDFDDHQHEVGGQETGRAKKTFVGEASKEAAARRAGRRIQSGLSALDVLMSDPEYAALYKSTMDLLGRAETATEDALHRARGELDRAEDALESALGDANKLPDGTAIIRDENGAVWTADGRRVEGEALEGVVWKEGAVSYEDFLKRRKALEEARKRVEDLQRYQTDVLGRARDRISDPDNPPTKEELEEIQKDIEEKAPGALKMAEPDLDLSVGSSAPANLSKPPI